MKNQWLRSTFVIAATAGLLNVAADAQVRPANRPALRNAIDLSKANAIRAPSLETIRILEEKVSSAPATEATSGSIAAAAPAPATAEIIPETERGKLYHVELRPSEETTIAKQLASQQTIQAQGAALVTIPGVYRQLAADGAELLLKPFVIPQKLSLDAATGQFVGSIKIGLHEIGGPAPRRDLSAPISFQVLEDDVASPEELTVRHSGLPMTRIRISAQDAPNGLRITVASPFEPQGTPVILELAPAFAISVSRSIEGLGFEAGTVTVSARGLEKPEGQKVRLTVDGSARADNEELKLDKDGNASTTVRSVGTGPAVVHASLAGFRTVQATMAMTIPYLTLAASAVGGLVGGLIRLLPGLRRGSARRFLLGLAVALLVGMLVFGLYAVGVNVLPITPKVRVGAVLVLVISAMGAYLGSGVLGGPKAPPPDEGEKPEGK